ncbi:hypothetical protein [Rhizobium leguminosarum]|uniref:hypothetical protein n=1 Tax=Rhizobium leguminosarum TaxID=384 RepID=UPI001C911359|nr:hypothetical protein [Rhizobium leguminosarum]MBY3026066.1 hypothetical protein [Rhizobium leguminosarum]
MQHEKITRTQHPVGRGGFHSGLISTVEGSPDGVRSANERPVTSFSYVYDCGSERSDAFNSTVASSGHMMASAGWERVTPRFGMTNGASHGGRFSKALLTELRS